MRKISLCGFAAYGSNATVAKTDEELEDRHQSLFGDADSADDIKITMPSNDGVNGAHLKGEGGSNGQIPTQMHNGTDEPNPTNVSLSKHSTLGCFGVLNLAKNYSKVGCVVFFDS